MNLKIGQNFLKDLIYNTNTKSSILDTLIAYNAGLSRLKSWKKDIKEEEQLPLNVIELWDAFSYDIQVWTKRLLKNCDVDIVIKGKGKMSGEYLFTIDSCHSDPNMINTSVAEVPSEHKQFNFGKLVNGQYFAQPNNRMLWYEQSLTPSELKMPDFKVASKYYFCEQDHKWVFGDSDEYFYKEKERKD